MARIGRIDVIEEADGSTVFARRGVKPPALARIYHVTLGLLAVSGLLRLAFGSVELVVVAMAVLGILAMVLGLIVHSLGLYGGLLQMHRERLIVRPQRGEATGYRDGPRPPELLVDGRSFPLEALREVVVGHIAIQSQYGTQHQYPVYAVLDGAVIEVANHNAEGPSVEVGEALANAAGVTSRRRETGQLIRGGGVALLVTIILAEVAALAGAMAVSAIHQGDGLVGTLGRPVGLAAFVLAANLGLDALGASFLRRSVDAKVREVFGVGR